VNQWWGRHAWFLPQAFSRRDLRYFSAFSNVHTLRLPNFEISHFVPYIERYFGHFSPTLRSLTLFRARCTPQLLSHFLSLFSNLDDIELREIPTFGTGPENLAPFSAPAPKLRGRLTLDGFHQAGTWTYLVGLCGGLGFRHIDLHNATTSPPVLLEACAKTLETLRFDMTDGTYSKPPCIGFRIELMVNRI